jgi:hypothetical protein
LDAVLNNKSNPASEKAVQKYLKDMLKNITEAVEQTGFVNPLNKVYALSKPLDQMPVLFVLLTIYTFDFMMFSPSTSSIMMLDPAKRVDGVYCDGPAYLTGLITIFKQFHPQNERTFLNLLCHYFKNEVFK